MTTKGPIPDTLMNMISCGCKTGCGTSCGCRKIGMKCSPMCSVCLGKICTNVPRELNTSDEAEQFCISVPDNEGNINELEENVDDIDVILTDFYAM